MLKYGSRQSPMAQVKTRRATTTPDHLKELQQDKMDSVARELAMVTLKITGPWRTTFQS